ncbi:hypothetical protein [Microcoleus sp. D3_18a_C4]|uniref:hypothetical protein n=1 Tax=Microcoleus sp. D3_18a_C4 TaxID=3055332 RepID=UPI002FD4679B
MPVPQELNWIVEQASFDYEQAFRPVPQELNLIVEQASCDYEQAFRPVPQELNLIVEQAGKPVAEETTRILPVVEACSTRVKFDCGTGRKACC